MNIAIQVADLDNARIDGTRVYIKELLKRFGSMNAAVRWHLYHRREFNPVLTPPSFENYHIHKVSPFPYWTQTRFAFEMWKSRPEKLWMPMPALPFFLPKGIQTTVTIHDLAFKYFPEYFPKKDLRRLNWFADFAIRKADKLIAVSESTKRDILKFYPGVSEEKIRVVYHGFDDSLFGNTKEGDQKLRNEEGGILEKYHLENKKYILYIGALQPRKNLRVLLESFSMARKSNPDMKLVLVGEKAWLWKGIFQAIEEHPFKKDIVLTGRVSFSEASVLYTGAKMFVFPSLYEGFGIPVLEAMASGVPVICADNSSLPEVGGDAALYFEASDASKLALHIEVLWSDDELCENLIAKGYEQIKKFSWDKCAKETMEYILK